MKTCWKEEREAYNEWLKNTFEPPETPAWLGNKDPKTALEELKRLKLSKDFKYKTDPLISGEEALQAWLERKLNTKNYRKEKTEANRIKSFNKKEEEIHETQDLLLTECYNALPQGCPLKVAHNPLQFFMDWHQFDPLVACMMFSDLRKNSKQPAQFLIAHQGIYSWYLKGLLKGQVGDLFDIDVYRNSHHLKGLLKGKKLKGKKPYVHWLEGWSEVVPNAPFIEFTQRWKEHEDRVDSYKELIKEQPQFESPELNRLNQRLNLFAEHFAWIHKEGTEDDKWAWEKTLKLCLAGLENAKKGSSVVTEIVFAHKFLMSTWAENKIYLCPTQLDIKKFMIKHLKGSNCRQWKNGADDDSWSQPMNVAKTFIYLPRGIKRAHSGWAGATLGEIGQ